MVSPFSIRPLHTDAVIIAELSNLLIAVVAKGGSVSFMYPLPISEASAFWTRALTEADKSNRVVLGAYINDKIVGTASLLLDCPPNQPHRAEIAKMMTAPDHRGKGIARALLLELESIAIKHERMLINLDTAAEEGALQN